MEMVVLLSRTWEPSSGCSRNPTQDLEYYLALRFIIAGNFSIIKVDCFWTFSVPNGRHH
jgi:hypothetical protein